MHNPLPGIPLIESPLFATWLDQSGLSDDERRIATELHDRGFAVLRFADPDLRGANRAHQGDARAALWR